MGKAKKSTHTKRTTRADKRPFEFGWFQALNSPTKSPAKKKQKLTVPSLSAKEYEIDKIGPLHLVWGTKRVKGKKGKIVKKWYIRNENKQLVWIKWSEARVRKKYSFYSYFFRNF